MNPEVGPHRRLALVLAVQAVLVGAYWVAWTIDHSLVAATESREYSNFEAAFLLPDSFVAIISLLAARDLWTGRARGIALVLVGAGAGMFLGLIDLAYDVQNDIWSHGVNGAVEAVVVGAILLSASFYGIWGWFAFSARFLTPGRAAATGRAVATPQPMPEVGSRA